MTGLIVRDLLKNEVEYCWSCPVCKGLELKASSEQGIFDEIENHLLEDQRKGIIR
jgi:hypothetical protein